MARHPLADDPDAIAFVEHLREIREGSGLWLLAMTQKHAKTTSLIVALRDSGEIVCTGGPAPGVPWALRGDLLGQLWRAVKLGKVFHRCAGCGRSYEQQDGETERQAEDRHNIEAERVHNERRSAYFDAHPGALDAIREDEDQGW